MRTISDLHENEVAADIAGRRSLNSGAGVKKGDVSNQWWTVECKASLNKAKFKVTRGLLIKTANEAKTRDKTPALSFAKIAGNVRLPKSLRVVRMMYLVPVSPPSPALQSFVTRKDDETVTIDLTDPYIRNANYFFKLSNKTGVFQWWSLKDRVTGRLYLREPKRSAVG